MIGSLGVPELLFVLVLALLIFGPRKLPEIGKTLGRAMGEFRRATSDLKRTLDVELSTEQRRTPHSAPVTQSVTSNTPVETPSDCSSESSDLENEDSPADPVADSESREDKDQAPDPS